jgi:alpha-beta hydrolase superfamily lysophospholipase
LIFVAARWIIILGFLFSSAAFAACEPARDRQIDDVTQSFSRYVQSEIDCGVHADALPYILRADPDVPLKGSVVLVHGLAGNPMHLRQIAEQLQAQGYNVVAPLLQGHGGDDYFLATSKLENWQKDVHYAGLIAQKLGSPVFIGGHSTGGTLAAIEASEGQGHYNAIFALDPAFNLEGVLASKATYACLGSYVATFETDKVVSVVAGTPHRSFQEQIEEMKEATKQLVERHCGKDFPIPSFNSHYTLAGICALSQAVAKVKKLKAETLPPIMVLKSKDPDFYGQYVSAEELAAFVTRNPHHALVQTDAESHELMPGNCCPGFDKYVGKIVSWLNSYGRTDFVEGTSGTVTR